MALIYELVAYLDLDLDVSTPSDLDLRSRFYI